MAYDLPRHCLSVGDGVLIYWDGDRKWYPGEITGAAGDHNCEVLYMDGEREWVSLNKVKYIVKRNWDGSIRRRSKKAKSGEDSGREADNQIEAIKDILFDIGDRLPHEGVYEENPEWWKIWHDGILLCVKKNDVQGLIDATLCLSQQLKPNIMSEWWAKHGADWKNRLKNAVTTWDVVLLVKEMQNNAINWSIARKLFPGTGDCESQIKVMGIGRSSLHKFKPDNEKDEPPFPRIKKTGSVGWTKDCSSISSSFPMLRKGKMPMVACRRSNRLRKSTFEGALNSKCSDSKDLLESPCSTEPAVISSFEAEIHGDLVSAPSSNKIARIQYSERGTRNRSNHDSSKCENIPQPKEDRRYTRKAEQSDAITDPKDYPLDEMSAGDDTEACIYRLADGLLCSVCQIGVASNFFLQCKISGCFCVFHTFCLNPPAQKVEEDWLCPYCAGDALTRKLTKEGKPIAKRIQSIVGHKRVILEHKRNEFQDQFLIKWESLSHHHDSWVPSEWLYVIDRARLHSYRKRFPIMNGDKSVDQRKPEWLKIDRVIACRRKLSSDKLCQILDVCQAKQRNEEFEFLVKWMGLDYCDATWESPCTEELLAEVARLVERHERAAERAVNYCPISTITPLDKTPDNLHGGVLYDYQLQGVQWILSNFKAKRNVILADEMGLGKTIQLVSFVHCMKQAKLNANPVLVIAPKSILFQWEKEFCYWAKALNVIIYQGEKKSRRCIQAHEMYSSEKRVLFDALITNYELVILDKSTLSKFKWSAIIIDEAHKIKSLDCKLASYLKRYTSDFRLLSTGTPLQNTLLELFALLHFIDPEHFSDPRAEAEAFSSIKSGLQQSGEDVKIAQIHELLRPRMLRRMKSDVLPGFIPVKKWVEIPCALTDSQRELYINILEKNYKKLNKGIEYGKKIVLNFILMELKKCCNHPYLFPGQEIYHSSREAVFMSLVAKSGKLQLLEKLLPKLKERGSRVLLFSQMTKMLDILEEFLIFLGLAYFRIDGRTSIAARQQQMKEFNNPGTDVFIFLMSTRAGGLGIDLPTADRVIIYDPDFNPFMDLQAQSRAHRIGQTRPVVVYQLITKCSVEEKILQKSKAKLAIENLVMNPSKKPSVSELHSVLLHGARRILSRKRFHASSVHYDDDAIESLLKLDPVPGEKCSPDENGYLGSILSFVPGEAEAEAEAEAEERPPSPKAEEWKQILGPVSTETTDGDLGRGKRQKKEVKYELEDDSDSDEVYSPEGSSTDASSDELESEAVDGEI